MKKILLTLMVLLATVTVQAKVIKITMSDGSWKIYTSSQLSEISFNEDGTASVVGYDGELLATLDPDIDEITINDDVEIMDITEKTLSFDVSAIAARFGIDLSSSSTSFDVDMTERDVTQFSFVYPSTDPYGDPVTLSAMLTIPNDILNGEVKSDGILLFNHFTYSDTSWSPSNGFLFAEPVFLCNPYTPDYILVEADLYGFGVSARFPQAFVQGHANERASLDALLAARQLLRSMNINEGGLTFNVGYSSGGFEALSTQRCRDMEYADKISFTKTFAGGSPSDVRENYRELVRRDTIGYSCVLAMIIAATNETQHLNKEYTEFFVPEVAAKIEPVVLSKKYNLLAIEPVLGAGKIIHNILTEPYCNLDSEESQNMQDVLATLNLTQDWTPDRSQRIFIMNVEDDNVVPLSAAMAMVDYLKEHGMRTSIIPGLGNLQTDFSSSGMGHIAGFFPFVVKVISSIATWSIMYTDGVMKPEWQELLKMEDSSARELTPYEKCEAGLYDWLESSGLKLR